MSRTVKKERYLYMLSQLGIAICLLFFFMKACPLVAFDVDDWLTMGNFRLPIPIWKGAEAARVMPEVLMPVMGWLAARIVYPFCKDYAYSVTVTSATILTFLIMAMGNCLKKLLVTRCKLTPNITVGLEIIFLTLFFLIFRNRGSSQCMFTAADLCCIYFYTISGILNGIVVLIFLRYDDMTEMFLTWNPFRKALFFLLLYFSLFSNLFHSAMTAIYAGIYVLLNFWHNKYDPKQFIRENAIYLLVLTAWGIALVFDANGGRADAVGMDMSLDFKLSFSQLLAMLHALSLPFIIILASLAITVIFLMLKRECNIRHEAMHMFVSIICNEALLTVFLLLLNAKLAYMSRIDATWGIWFYLILFSVAAAAFVIYNIPLMSKLLPIVIPILIFLSLYPDGKFLMSTREHTDYQTCMELDHYVINSIVTAEQKGMAEITIRIPDHSNDLRSLAYNKELGNAVANCLYTHGIIAGKVEVNTIVEK